MIDIWPKRKPWRSKTYTDWVKVQPSILSGLPADDPHHLLGPGYSGSGRAPDWATIPLTRGEHVDLHQIGWRAWEIKHEITQTDLLYKFWLMNFDRIQEFLRN